MRAAFAIGVVVLLAGCGQGNERIVRDPESGQAVAVRTGQAVAPPANLPPYAPVYPGARVTNSINSVSSGDTGAQKGGMFSFETDHDQAQVVDFYRQRLATSALSERSETNINGAIILGASDPNREGDTLQVTISSAEHNRGSVGSVIYSTTD
jgi:hypothetical protein